MKLRVKTDNLSLPLGIGYALIQFSQANSKKSSHGSVVSDNDANILALSSMHGLELQIFYPVHYLHPGAEIEFVFVNNENQDGR